MSTHQAYKSPLESRYASPAMRAIWSDDRKYTTWRRLWLALAEAQQELGLDITDAQLDQLRAHLTDIDYEAAAVHESKLRHDVMAHIHALGDVAPDARPIIHLGATSQFVNCNTELLQIRDSLHLVAGKIARIVDALGTFALHHRHLPTLGFTHLQPAQPTTVGKRAAIWAQDYALSLEDIEHRLDALRFRGVKGTTGTQASFLALFDDDPRKAQRLDELVTEKMGWPVEKHFAVTGQTYPRLVDAQVLNALAVVAAVTHKVCNDIRLLANRKELEEPFAATQVGSSAMPYKRNPMRCERATSLARFVMSLAQNPLNTAATQWLERTLDDSANRRLVLPEAFLALDGILDIMHNVFSGLVVYEKTITANLMAELPFMASENLLMAAVQNGADRQEAHELFRKHSQAAGEKVKAEGGENDLLDRLRGEAMFRDVDFDAVMDPSAYVGRAPEQVNCFMAEVVEPIRLRYAGELGDAAELKV
ncbi:MAG: adenylosuccinate lyase [Phycisphaerales bacterium]|nr:MAG: adenylosuccinate lyase [Phycisphaerales bacterium]